MDEHLLLDHATLGYILFSKDNSHIIFVLYIQKHQFVDYIK